MGSELRYINIKVYCPSPEPGTPNPVDMEMVYTNLENGRFFFPCIGCDFANGSKKCQDCQAALTLMFYHNFNQIDITKPITPKYP